MSAAPRRCAGLLALAVLAGTVAAGGCFRAQFTNGWNAPPAPTATYEWYLSLAWVIDLRGPVSFKEVCAGGDWVELKMWWGPASAIVSALTGTLVVPQATQVVCPGGYRVEGLSVGDQLVRVTGVHDHDRE